MHASDEFTIAPEWLRRPTDTAHLDEGVWPMTAQRTDSGELEIGGVGVRTLIDEYGSPLYVIDEQDARGRAAATLAAFQSEFAKLGAEVELHYASKALLTIDVARWMAQAGLGLDVASGGELEVALAAGVNPATIGMHGNNKLRSELVRAVTNGIGCIIIDSLEEIALLAQVAAECGVRQKVMVRINVGVHASTHDYLATSHEDQKFGLTREAALEAVATIRASDSLELIGLHSHIGSSIYEAAGFGAAAGRLMRLRAQLLTGGPVPEINLGGGFGINYLPSDNAPDIAELAAAIATEVRRVCEETGSDVPRFVFEPGRSIIGPAGVTLYTVGTTKRVTLPGTGEATRNYVSVDGGMSDNTRPALYGADYCVRLASRASTAAPELARVVGRHCEAGDIVVNADYLPADVSRGDVLAVPATGAYCFSMASNYNYLERPAIVAVRDGTAKLLVRRVTTADLLSYDAAYAPAATTATPESETNITRKANR